MDETHPSGLDSRPTNAELDRAQTTAKAIAANVSGVLTGKDDVVLDAMCCLAAEGHLLIEDVPGVGKTTLARALAFSIAGSVRRVQFTPDLLPTDLIGVNVWQASTSTFVFRPGPAFANLVLADEINRASPKTQSALLEAMEEHQVTVDGETYKLPRPHMVIATQNPIEHEGTYPLPESQLDRFAMRIAIGYPDLTHELAMIDIHAADTVAADSQHSIAAVTTTDDVVQMIATTNRIYIDPKIKEYVVSIIQASRTDSAVRLGLSPRATIVLLRCARARALLVGHEGVWPDDVKAVAHAVLDHRLLTTFEADARGVSAADVVDRLFQTVPVPTGG